MPQLSTRSRYGLRFLIDLAERGSRGPVDLGSVAARQGISEQYLAKLAIPLKSAGMIRAERGSKGGYALAKKPEDIDLWSVVELLEGRSSLLDCTADPGSCSRSGDCRTHPIWTGLDRAVRGYLCGLSLADAAAPAASDYVI
jgi:Rrf2 family protein